MVLILAAMQTLKENVISRKKKKKQRKELQKMQNELQEKKDGEDVRNNLISSI